MSFLNQIKPQKKDLLASLPYRVGLYISQSDQTGGDESDEAEMRALSGIVTAYSRDVFGSENIQYIMNETVSRKAEWGAWESNIANVANECNEAVDLMSSMMDEKELNAFRRYMLEIGESVALAFREYGDSTSLVEKVQMYLAYLKSKKSSAKHGLPPKDWNQFINISMAERRALQKLAQAMGVTYI